MNPEFTALVDSAGVRITDPIERTQFDLHAPSPVSPDLTDADAFYFPVDTAVAVRTPWLRTTKGLDVYVRNTEGELVAESSGGSPLDLTAGAYNLELASTQMKVYLAVESEVSISGDTEAVEISFGGETRVEIGARSLHERPAGTITVPDDVGATMDAVSLLGSALKTTTCERSFPSLRGHPPLMESGDEFAVEGDVRRPETGVTVEVPEEREAVYEVAPLAFYLGADVVPGESPRLLADGLDHPLDAPGDLQQGVKRTLQQVFFLDCVTRTEGYYEVDLHERAELEPHVDLDFESLYDASLSEQLRRYLDVPYETVEPHLPRWKVTMDVSPTHENAAVLPFAADELAVVRCPDDPDPSTVDPEPEVFETFYRDAGEASTPTNVIEPEPADSIEHVWVGEEMPIGASKATLESLKRRLDVTPRHQITVDVVCNDDRMREEDVVGDIYGTRDLYDFSVSVHNDLTTGELRNLLESETDFLHYIGHVDDEGIRCTDGMLDVGAIDETGVRGFILNGCRSYEQGEALVEKGSQVGVVTLAKVGNEPATEVGKELARLLNYGLTFGGAVSVVMEEQQRQYTVLGDGGMELVKTKCGIPLVIHVEQDNEGYSVEFHAHATANFSMGTLMSNKYGPSTVRTLGSSVLSKKFDSDDLEQCLSEGENPVKLDGDLFWSDDLSVGDI